ncbi:MAG: dCTP deaminase [Nanoarchaeota archaeon]|nr:dCTP deaminase [Nanoarchaeota archaeon]MBU1030694.1 dCTP deaminase [Nanoarchaeota archaeon]MBU1849353.1 dCTP deaminase [Nanoarchaeota archaeon]
MILTRDKILEEVRLGHVRIEPFCEENVGPASIDLTLDNKFRYFKKTADDDFFDIVEGLDFNDVTNSCEVTDRYILKPGETILGITRETVFLPENICGWLQGRSRFARVGLTVHITASFVHPGVSNKQVLEIHNEGPVALALYPGTRICQLILQRCEGGAKYAGRFEKQELY